MRAVDQHGSPANLFADMEDALIRARREVRHLDAYRSGMFLPARYLQFRLEQAVEDSTLARSPAEVGSFHALPGSSPYLKHATRADGP